jgi:hypothetical protein
LSGFPNGIEIPPIEKIEQMEQQRLRAVKALEISESDNSVKCQVCGRLTRLLDKPNRPKNDAALRLENRIKRIEEQRYAYAGKQEELKALRQQHVELLQEDAGYDLERRLTLHYLRGKFRCWNCIH